MKQREIKKRLRIRGRPKYWVCVRLEKTNANVYSFEYEDKKPIVEEEEDEFRGNSLTNNKNDFYRIKRFPLNHLQMRKTKFCPQFYLLILRRKSVCLYIIYDRTGYAFSGAAAHTKVFWALLIYVLFSHCCCCCPRCRCCCECLWSSHRCKLAKLSTCWNAFRSKMFGERKCDIFN